MTGTAQDNNNNSLGHWQTFFTDWKDGNSGKLHLDVREGVILKYWGWGVKIINNE